MNILPLFSLPVIFNSARKAPHVTTFTANRQDGKGCAAATASGGDDDDDDNDGV